MSPKYTHMELDKEVDSIAGYYTPLKEIRLKHGSREALCIIGEAVIESSCCGVGSWRYALVPGYIASWQSSRNEAGLLQSEVEPVSDKASRKEIKELIEATEPVSLFEFW
ncbi:MAG: hypothetical protein ABH839_02745 [Chloroflexota bacterium]